MDLRALQDEEYKALEYLSAVCKKNGLKLFLRGGSVLGAVKYRNFVPWDDDIDVALPRKDYEQLIKLVPETIDSNLQFVAYQKTKNAHCYFPRIILNDRARIEKGFPKNNERGLVLIDILPIDGMPDKGLSLKLHIVKAYFYRILASLWTLEVSDTVSMHGGKKDKILKFLHALNIHRLYKQDTIYKRLDKLYSKYGYGNTRNCGMLASSKLKKEIVPYTWWENGTYGTFRDLKIRLPKKYDKYLKRLFGDDYATYEPSESERNKSHLTGKE